MMTLKIQLTGMHCSACVEKVRERLDASPGVKRFDVLVGEVTVDLDTTVMSKADLFAALRDAGPFDIQGFSNLT